MPVAPTPPVEPPVVAGQALTGISAADYTAAAAEGADFRVIGVAMQKNAFVIASLPGNPVNTPADPVGKKIGMALANTPALQALCTLHGVDIACIEVVPTPYDAAPLVSGQVDCLLCWQTDLPVAMTMQGVNNVTMLMADHGDALHAQTCIAKMDSLIAALALVVFCLPFVATGPLLHLIFGPGASPTSRLPHERSITPATLP